MNPHVNPDLGRFELIDKAECCRMFGGINPATLYRGIRDGRFPKPVKIGAVSRGDRAPKKGVVLAWKT